RSRRCRSRGWSDSSRAAQPPWRCCASAGASMSASRAAAIALTLSIVAAAARGSEPPATGWLAEAQRRIAEREDEASRDGDALQAPNRAQNLRTYFGAVGIRVHDRTAAGSPDLLALSLAGVGRGTDLAAPTPGEVASDGARVEIRRPGLVEWYVNTP